MAHLAEGVRSGPQFQVNEAVTHFLTVNLTKLKRGGGVVKVGADEAVGKAGPGQVFP